MYRLQLSEYFYENIGFFDNRGYTVFILVWLFILAVKPMRKLLYFLIYSKLL